jgi:AcrR family transcriptional regulator
MQYSDRLDSQPNLLEDVIMPKKAPAGGQEARQAILEATLVLLRERRAGDVTTDEIARRAGCAKGLVHYHFKRKPQLLAAAAEHLWANRAKAWSESLGKGDPKASIGAAWKLLASEAEDGTAATCAAIGLGSDQLVVQSVSASRRAFAAGLTSAISALLGRMGLVPTVQPSELGTLLAATIEGIALQLGNAARPDEFEQAWAAFWVGLLSLTRPGRT